MPLRQASRRGDARTVSIMPSMPKDATSADMRGDEQLLLDYAAGDAAAFAQLYERHERPVYRYLLRSLAGDAARADDLLQETWFAVVRNAANYEPRAKFTTWLYGIARTRLIDHWRAQKDDVSLSTPAANDEDESLGDFVAASRVDEPEVRALSRAQAGAFMAAVERLPHEQREALLLHAEGDLSANDIAQLTGVGMETAKSRLRYALAKLRTAMENWR